MATPQTFEDWLHRVYYEWIRTPFREGGGIRLGQFYFNKLDEFRPGLAATIRGTDNDPFYVNDNIPAFLAAVATGWDDPSG